MSSTASVRLKEFSAVELSPSVFPERRDRKFNAFDAWSLGFARGVRERFSPVLYRLQQIARQADAQRASVIGLADGELRERLIALAPQAVGQCAPGPLAQALALMREVARRSLGKEPFISQLTGAAGLLNGRLVEMQTGEGKTLTAGVAACLAGLAGLSVHVVTVNDYLAERDAEEMTPLAAFLGLRVGVIVHGLSPMQKRAAYAANVTWCTNKELVFDYLRDRVSARGSASRVQVRLRELTGQPGAALMMRGLYFAIVDEADSVLIDEARTPLILAERGEPIASAEVFEQALARAATLTEGNEFTLDVARRVAHLTAVGREMLAQWSQSIPGQWRSVRSREHLIAQALRAQHLFIRDRQYLVDEGKVQIIDEYTGRVLEGRTWDQGLHQMIEAKEGCELSADNRTLARITYQRFFRRYLRLSGMTGTARELRGELRQVYGLSLAVVPTNRPSQRKHRGVELCADQAQKWARVAETALAQRTSGRPVLIGTRSLSASEALSAVLSARGIGHRVLNARQDAEEADIVAVAGERGAVTVATNMAGRGTDIRLGEGVAELGGLAVILTEFHDSPRIDRQLYGRCARQGDPGECCTIIAVDDHLFADDGPVSRMIRQVEDHGRHRWRQRAVMVCRALAQSAAERRHARERGDTLKHDYELDTQMALAGNPI